MRNSGKGEKREKVYFYLSVAKKRRTHTVIIHRRNEVEQRKADRALRCSDLHGNVSFKYWISGDWERQRQNWSRWFCVYLITNSQFNIDKWLGFALRHKFTMVVVVILKSSVMQFQWIFMNQRWLEASKTVFKGNKRNHVSCKSQKFRM